MGKFLRVATAGINFKLPWLDQIAGRIDLRVQQLALDVETKTKDNVFVKIPVSVQYHVIPEKVYESFYKLANPKQQISSYVFNVILGHVPKMNLDDAFLQQSDLAGAIKDGLDDVMTTYAISESPFGGRKDSGIGHECGHEGLLDNLDTKLVSFGNVR